MLLVNFKIFAREKTTFHSYLNFNLASKYSAVRTVIRSGYEYNVAFPIRNFHEKTLAEIFNFRSRREENFHE